MKPESHECLAGGDRLDHYLSHNKFCTSRSEAGKWIKDKFVKVNGAIVKASYKVQEGDDIEIVRPPLKATDLVPKKIDFEILHEDEDLLVVNKPAGLVVHPGAGNYDESLVHGLLFHCKDLSGIGGVERPGIVHRLDKGTSGVMVVAKNDKTHQHLSLQFQNKTIRKEYVALSSGEIAKEEQKLVHLMKRAEINRKKFVVNQKKGKEAITHVTVISQNPKISLVRVRIETGRTHQIRVHLHYIGHAIIGDEVYGATAKLKQFNDDEREYIRRIGHPLLHSRKLTFIHPANNKEMTFETLPPDDFIRAAKKFMKFEVTSESLSA